MSVIYGYCRISQRKQSIDRQIRNIKAEYPEAVIVQEAYTGTRIDRPEWTRLFARVKAGDTIVFDSVSRMSRNADEGFEAYQILYDRGVSLVYLQEPQINTATYKASLDGLVGMTNTDVDYILEGVNKYLMSLARLQIKLVFDQAEKEVNDLHQRTREGIETARLAGKQIGAAKGSSWETKKAKAAKALILKHSRHFGGGLSDSEMTRLCGISHNTLYKYKRELAISQQGASR